MEQVQSAFVSRYGDRRHGDFVVTKTGVNRYSFEHAALHDMFVLPVPLTPNRVVTQERFANHCNIYTFNLRDGHHPGSDLRILLHPKYGPTIGAYARFNNAVVAELANAKAECNGTRMRVQGCVDIAAFDTTEWQWVIQPLTNHFAVPQRTAMAHPSHTIEFETLVTRVPPTPIETNVEVALVKHIGPLRNR